MQELDDTRLVSAAVRGDAASFEELVRRYQGRVRSFFAARLRDLATVDDLSQDVFLLAFRHLAAFDASKPFYPWLKGIATNVWRNALRKHSASTVAEPDELDSALDELAVAESENLERQAGSADVLDALRQCCQGLQGTAAHLVREHYSLGRALSEIGAELNKTSGALAVTLLRIRNKLRECIQARLAGQVETEALGQ
jgi:RNA polymerase sigma-70 factor (ECF subfamily)